MSGVGHTPGPWEVHPSRVTVFTGTPTPNGRIAIADCRIGRIDEREANARLIAAAPELLETLELAMLCHFDFWAEQARAAIAKAKGGESC